MFDNIGYFETKRTARYFTLGSPESARQFWVVLHGYGMLPAYWIRKFQPIVDAGAFVLAPEALSRYYVGDGYERVGASWMTKEDRDIEIKDYVAYLDGLLGMILSKKTNLTHLPLHILGFSQGAATAWRWTLQGKHTPQALSLWGGAITKEPLQQLEAVSRVYHIRNQDDELIPPTAWKSQEEWLKDQHADVRSLSPSGKHEVCTEGIQQLFQGIEGI